MTVKEAGKIFLSGGLSLLMAKERRTNSIGTSRNIPPRF